MMMGMTGRERKCSCCNSMRIHISFSLSFSSSSSSFLSFFLPSSFLFCFPSSPLSFFLPFRTKRHTKKLHVQSVVGAQFEQS